MGSGASVGGSCINSSFCISCTLTTILSRYLARKCKKMCLVWVVRALWKFVLDTSPEKKIYSSPKCFEQRLSQSSRIMHLDLLKE